MSAAKISPERQFLIEDSLATYVGEWCTKHEVQTGELIVCLLALAARCQRLSGQTLAEGVATASYVTPLVGNGAFAVKPGGRDALLRYLTGKRKTRPS